MGLLITTRLFLISSFLLLAILALNFIHDANAQEGTNDSYSDDTVRVDPLDDLNKYRGGFDITNKHYWSSTAFTGIYGFAIGAFWLLCGIIYGSILLATKYCCTKRDGKHSKIVPSPEHYNPFWPISIALVFTFLAIAASGLVLGATAKFHSEAKTVVNIIMDTADEASVTIYNTTGAMRAMRDGLGETSGFEEATGFLTSTSQQLDSASANIEREARKNRRLIDRGLKIVFIVTMITIPITLIVVLLLSVVGILRLRRSLYWLIMVCWLLTALSWIFFGIYFFVSNFSRDTCTAFENFQEDPYNNSLSSILPCDDLRTAQPVLSQVSQGIYNLVDQVNENISSLRTTQFPNLAFVCNPFSGPPDYQYQANNCPPNTIPIGDIPTLLSTFTCSGGTNRSCREGEFIPYNEFQLVQGYTRSVQNLVSAYPNMESLVECQVVQDAFSEILDHHCGPAKRFVRMVWASMLTLSIIMLGLLLFWTVTAHQELGRHKPTDGSVNPDDHSHPTTDHLHVPTDSSV